MNISGFFVSFTCFNIYRKFSDSHSLLLLLGLLCGLGGGASGFLGGYGFDDTDSNGLSHVTDSKATQGREVRESFHAHGLAGDQLDNSGISGLDELGVGFSGLS